MMRVKQRQTGEQFSIIRNVSISTSLFEDRTKEASAAWTSLAMVGITNSESVASVSAKVGSKQRPWLQLS